MDLGKRLALAFALILLVPASTLAHNMVLGTKLLPDHVRVEVYFDTDEPADDAPVFVRDADGAVIASGKTDDKGVWQFPRPKPGRYVIRCEFIGHDREVALTIADDTSTGEFQTWKPNKLVGVAVGVGVLLVASLAFALRKRKGRNV